MVVPRLVFLFCSPHEISGGMAWALFYTPRRRLSIVSCCDCVGFCVGARELHSYLARLCCPPTSTFSNKTLLHGLSGRQHYSLMCVVALFQPTLHAGRQKPNDAYNNALAQTALVPGQTNLIPFLQRAEFVGHRCLGCFMKCYIFRNGGMGEGECVWHFSQTRG